MWVSKGPTVTPMLTLSKGEEAVQTDTQNLQNQQASANNDPETKSSNLDEMRSMLTKAGEANKTMGTSLQELFGDKSITKTADTLGDVISSNDQAIEQNDQAISDAKQERADAQSELESLQGELDKTATLNEDAEIATLEQEIRADQNEYDRMQSVSEGAIWDIFNTF